MRNLVPCVENGFGLRRGIRKGKAKIIDMWLGMQCKESSKMENEFSFTSLLNFKSNFLCSIPYGFLSDKMVMLKLKSKANYMPFLLGFNGPKLPNLSKVWILELHEMILFFMTFVRSP